MTFYKTFESFDIQNIFKEINKIELLNIDPYNEEDWYESEDGDIVYRINQYMDIDIQKYDSLKKLYRYKKLNRSNLLNDLIKIRNRKITQYKVKSEKLFRLISKKKLDFNKRLNDIMINGEVENSDKNISLINIKEQEISGFTFYYFTRNEKDISVDKYECKILKPSSDFLQENNDLFIDDMWDEHIKYINDISITLKQITFNVRDEVGGPNTLVYNIYYPQLEHLVNNNEIILESTNVKNKLKIEFDKITKKDISSYINEINRILVNINSVDVIMGNKLKNLEKRFPQIKKS